MPVAERENIEIVVEAVGFFDVAADQVAVCASALGAEYDGLPAEFFPVVQPRAALAGCVRDSVDIFKFHFSWLVLRPVRAQKNARSRKPDGRRHPPSRVRRSGRQILENLRRLRFFSERACRPLRWRGANTAYSG